MRYWSTVVFGNATINALEWSLSTHYVSKFGWVFFLKRTWVSDGRVFILVHYDDVIMGAIASQITSLTIVYSTVYSGSDQSKHQNSASLAFVWGIHRGPVNSPHKWPVTRKNVSIWWRHHVRMRPLFDHQTISRLTSYKCVYYNHDRLYADFKQTIENM